MQNIIEALKMQSIVISHQLVRRKAPNLFNTIEGLKKIYSKTGERHFNDLTNLKWKNEGYDIKVEIYERNFVDSSLQFYFTPIGLEQTSSGPAWLIIDAQEYYKNQYKEAEYLLSLIIKNVVQ